MDKVTVKTQMKLGSETGSLTNWLLSAGPQGIPVVGEGATEYLYTDRHAYWVTWVSPDGKECTIVRAKAVRSDNNGMSDAQSYTYEHHENEMPTKLVFKWGSWRKYCPNNEKKYPKITIKFGVMQEYYDYSF